MTGNDMKDFKTRYGPWALVTGATRGIGAEFSRQCADRGLNVILVARDGGLLREQCELIRSACSVEAVAVPLDLTREDILDALAQATDGREVGLLVCNAAESRIKPFIETDEGELVRDFYVNARAPLLLARRYGGLMAGRKRGGIIILSSVSALRGSAYVAGYAAAKAHNLALAEGIWYELSGRGVDVLGFMPGMTRTPGFDRQMARPVRGAPIMTAEETAFEALEALGKTPSLIAGWKNRLAEMVLGRLFTRRRAIITVSKAMEKMFSHLLGGK
jgi:short-subunit dehydrogenase